LVYFNENFLPIKQKCNTLKYVDKTATIGREQKRWL